jgi:hypothetical protein
VSGQLLTYGAWRSYRRADFPNASWAVEGDILHALPGGYRRPHHSRAFRRFWAIPVCSTACPKNSTRRGKAAQRCNCSTMPVIPTARRPKLPAARSTGCTPRTTFHRARPTRSAAPFRPASCLRRRCAHARPPQQLLQQWCRIYTSPGSGSCSCASGVAILRKVGDRIAALFDTDPAQQASADLHALKHLRKTGEICRTTVHHRLRPLLLSANNFRPAKTPTIWTRND